MGKLKDALANDPKSNAPIWSGDSMVISQVSSTEITAPGSGTIAGAPITGNLKAGPVEIHPSIELKETYSDNIYRNYGGLKKESDFIPTLEQEAEPPFLGFAGEVKGPAKYTL